MLTMTLLILNKRVILIYKSNKCMAGKTTYPCKLSLTEVKELIFFNNESKGHLEFKLKTAI